MLKVIRGMIWILVFAVGVTWSLAAAEPRKPVTVPGKTVLPLRVLARPYSNIYKAIDGEIAQENVPVFQTYYVYTRPDMKVIDTKVEGWYEIGSDNRGTILGWMKAADVMEWKQTMCLAYTHPEGRNPVLMFEELTTLRTLAQSPSQERKNQVDNYFKTIKSGDIPPDFPIVSSEPNDYIDIVDQFYLLPILEYSPFEINGMEGRLLKIAAATKSERGGGSLKEAPQSFAEAAGSHNPEALLKGLQMDVVYVVDMTSSMTPYIQATLDVIKNMSLKMTQDTEVARSVNFGLWGYRDAVSIPGMEFCAKNFTDTLQSISDFEKTLAGVQVAYAGSKDYPEDVFSGVDGALRLTKWTDGAIRMVILLGDAPGHGPGHERNQSGQSAQTLRSYADDNQIYLFAVHIKDYDGRPFWEVTEEQFKALSLNPGTESVSSYWAVDSRDQVAFTNASKAIAEGFIDLVAMAKQGKIVGPSSLAAAGATTGSPSSGSNQADDINTKVSNLGHAALVQWIGKTKGTKAPPDVTAWIMDKDLVDPNVQAMDVRILTSKNELDSLKTVLQEIMTAGRMGLISGDNFFSALQSVPSVASRTGDQIKNARTIAETGLLPEFMLDLPYNSRVMNMSNELWASWGVDQQEEFLNEVDAKIKLYSVTHDNPDRWIALNQGDDPSEQVYPLSLEMLP